MQIIDVLLDIVRTPKKPQYAMAPEIPLVLHCCEFKGLQFCCSAGILIYKLDLLKLILYVYSMPFTYL